MSKSAFTVKVFGIYLIILAILLIMVPNMLLSIFGLTETSEVWIRVVGVMAVNMGVYYLVAAKSEAKAFFHASVYTRLLVFIAFSLFAALGLTQPILILFGGIDLSGGIWTFIALRTEK
jgi:hypothetical protein